MPIGGPPPPGVPKRVKEIADGVRKSAIRRGKKVSDKKVEIAVELVGPTPRGTFAFWRLAPRFPDAEHWE
jgi:hypothetical protein